MYDHEITLLAEKILALSKNLEQAIDPCNSCDKHSLSLQLAPLFTEILQLSCAHMSARDCFLLYLRIEKLEILSPDNAWFTGHALGHEPNKDEEAEHYCDSGGPEDFARKFGWLKRAYQEKQASD
jgi:hypothetical protein